MGRAAASAAAAGSAASGDSAVGSPAGGRAAVGGTAVMGPAAGSPAVGVVLFLLALLCFSFYDAFAKQMVLSYPAVVVNEGRYVTHALVAMVVLVVQGKLRLWRFPDQRLLILRGSALAIVATCFMTALVTMPLAEATAIYFTSPLIIVALSSMLLGERTVVVQWLAVGLGFVGMLLIVRPGGELPLVGTVLMTVAAVFYALFQMLTRRLSGSVPASVQFAYMSFICLLVTGVIGLIAPPAERPSAAAFAGLMAGGGVSAVAQGLLLAAFRRVPAATLAPLNYIQLLLAVLISSFWFARPPDGVAMAGIALIVAAGIGLAIPGWRQRRRSRRCGRRRGEQAGGQAGEEPVRQPGGQP